jgi:uncharacterized protein YqiB (DUF1249 family)
MGIFWRKSTMKTAARKEPAAPAIPSLAERTAALLEELLQADSQEARDILERWRETIDAKLDEIAEAMRPISIPIGYVRLQMDARGHGACPCQAYREAMK